MKLYFAALGLLKMFFAAAYFGLLLIRCCSFASCCVGFRCWVIGLLCSFALPLKCWCGYIVGVYLVLLNAL